MDCILFILFIIVDRFTTLDQQNAKKLFLRYLYYNITLNIPTCFGPHETVIRNSNKVMQHETKQVCASCWFSVVNLLNIMNGMNSIKLVMLFLYFKSVFHPHEHQHEDRILYFLRPSSSGMICTVD
jgi:penicillin V acylase-like amidase (Ntn superfamily)